MSASNFPYPKTLASIRLEKSILSWLEHEIFRIEIQEKATVDKADLFAIQKPKMELTGNQQHCVLFIMPRFGNLSKEAREFAATSEANVNAIAKAVVTPNLGMRIVANFFISRNKPAIPHKIFTQQEDAIEWLVEQKKQYVLKNRMTVQV